METLREPHFEQTKRRALAMAGNGGCGSRRKGGAMAQYNLGSNYGSGEGVKKDSAQAMSWFRKAADQGDNNAKVALDRLSNSRPAK